VLATGNIAKMNKNDIEKLFYIDKNYSLVKELLKDTSSQQSFNMLGKIELWSGNIEEAYENFSQAKNILACGYCKFLAGNNYEAKIILNLIKETYSAAKWIICLINIIEGTIEENPTYFQIKNFYEQDLNMLFIYEKYKYINTIIENNKYLENFNKEVYKYTARVLINNGCCDKARNYLFKSLEILYNDPETHFMLGEIYIIKNQMEKAFKEFTISNEVNGEYYPATKKLKDLTL
jgi:tetratricopeptide (TPR) repeat protein